MARNCPLHCRRQGRGRDERFGKALLILGRELDDRAFLDGLARGFLFGGDDEIRQRTALDLGGALQERVHLGGQAGFKAGCGCGFGHARIVRHFAVDASIYRCSRATIISPSVTEAFSLRS